MGRPAAASTTARSAATLPLAPRRRARRTALRSGRPTPARRPPRSRRCAPTRRRRPPAPSPASRASAPDRNCCRNQKPRKKTAGIWTSWVKMPERQQGHDARVRVERDVGAEHAGDRARRADRRAAREAGLGPDVRVGRRPAAEQVEDQVAHVPEAVLDVVAEDPEVEHVPDDVGPAAVQEHAERARKPSVRVEGGERAPRPTPSGRRGRCRATGITAAW